MDKIIKMPRSTDASTPTTHRCLVMEVITQDLYPEENFPKKYFPNIHSVLFNLFLDILKEREEVRAIYQSGKKKKKRPQ